MGLRVSNPDLKEWVAQRAQVGDISKTFLQKHQWLPEEEWDAIRSLWVEFGGEIYPSKDDDLECKRYQLAVNRWIRGQPRVLIKGQESLGLQEPPWSWKLYLQARRATKDMNLEEIRCWFPKPGDLDGARDPNLGPAWRPAPEDVWEIE